MTGNTDGLSVNPSQHFGHPNRPVEQISHVDIQVFLERLNEQNSNDLLPGWGYILPTEAQWEYACRAGATTSFSWGNSIDSSLANYNNNVGATSEVGSYQKNPWGFFDMHGNVWEWVGNVGSYSSHLVADPGGNGEGLPGILRGGSWTSYDGAASTWYASKRRNIVSTYSYSDIGFRVALMDLGQAPHRPQFHHSTNLCREPTSLAP